MIEAGVTWSVPQIIKQLEELEIAPEELQYLIISHAHFDHVCGIPGLKKAFPNLQILASEAAAKVLLKAKVVTGFFSEDIALAENLRRKGHITQTVPTPETPETINVDMVVTEGEQLDLGKGSIMYFSLLPGHSPCNTAAYLPLEQVLFASDCGGYPINVDTIFPMYFAGYEDYVTSLQKLRNIDVSVLAVPHELLLVGSRNISWFFASLWRVQWIYMSLFLRITRLVGDRMKLVKDCSRGSTEED